MNPLILVPTFRAATSRGSGGIPTSGFLRTKVQRRIEAALWAWMIINPIITPPVTDDRAFATRAILGEEQWIADPIKRGDIIALNALSTACLSVAGVTAWRRRPLPMAVAIAGSMAVILMTWRSYADLYDPGSSNLGSA